MSSAEVISSAAAGLAFVHLAVVSIILTIADVTEHRLPNRVVLPSYAIALILFVAASALASDPGRLLRAAAGMVILFAFYFATRFASPASIGGGDVKLAGLLGLYLGWLGWNELLLGAVAAFLIGGLYAVVLLSARRADRRTRIPFGPAMIAGAWIVIAAVFASNGAPTLPMT